MRKIETSRGVGRVLVPNMSSFSFLNSCEVLSNGTKYLWKDNVLFHVRDRESDPDYCPDEPWEFSHWRGEPVSDPVLLADFAKVAEKIPASVVWQKIQDQNKEEYDKLMKYLLAEYGTSLHCNRFAIGNCHEYAICDLVKGTGLEVCLYQDAKRIDIEILKFGRISIKYSSGGNIKQQQLLQQGSHHGSYPPGDSYTLVAPPA